MMNYTPLQSAENLFRAPRGEVGSNAEKLLNLRKGMQRRKRELRDTERKVRETARVEGQTSSAPPRTIV